VSVLAVTAPIFLIVALGFAAVRIGWIGPSDARALGGFVLRFAMPALIFKALSSRPLAEIADIRLLASYAAASLIAFAAVFACSRAAGGSARRCVRWAGLRPTAASSAFPSPAC